MTPRAIARRYATALFDVARQRGEVERVGRDLSAVRSLISAHPELRQVFDSAAVPSPKKRAVVEALLTAGGTTHDDVRRLLLMLAERDRLVLINDLADAYAEKAMTLARILPAEVTTAVPLGDEVRGALKGALSRATGSEVTLTERVDPAIIGGLVAKVGSVVFDGSVVRQLDKIKDRLASS
jgi:F-type H+-transporting ATPase subunit delta